MTFSLFQLCPFKTCAIIIKNRKMLYRKLFQAGSLKDTLDVPFRFREENGMWRNREICLPFEHWYYTHLYSSRTRSSRLLLSTKCQIRVCGSNSIREIKTGERVELKAAIGLFCIPRFLRLNTSFSRGYYFLCGICIVYSLCFFMRDTFHNLSNLRFLLINEVFYNSQCWKQNVVTVIAKVSMRNM
jgi:hypothetical protein